MERGGNNGYRETMPKVEMMAICNRVASQDVEKMVRPH